MAGEEHQKVQTAVGCVDLVSEVYQGLGDCGK